MIYSNKITTKSDLINNESLSVYDGKWHAQQNHESFEIFFYFLKEVKPKRILEIGTAMGGLTYFLKKSCNELNLECDILSFDIYEWPSYKEIKEYGVDIKIENIFGDEYSSIPQYVIDFIQSDGLTIVLCDGGNKKLEFNLLSNYIKENDFILAHDYSYDEKYFNENINYKIWNWLELTEKDIEEACNRNSLVDYRREVFQSVVWVCKMKSSEIFKKNEIKVLSEKNSNENNSKLTLVTGLWNIKRDSLTEGWSRSFQHYLDKFNDLLKIETNLIIFGEKELEPFVWERRQPHNTQFIVRECEWFKNSVPYEKIQEIRNNPDWYNQSGWLPDSTQAKLEMYNPLVMSKMFLLHDAKILDKFNSDEMYWIDAGITNTVHPGYFTHDKVQNNLKKYFNKFSFVCFPYKADKEIHGFSYPKINDYAESNVDLVARGGFFGGPKESISEINSIYYHTLLNTLSDGYMGTEESVFSIMTCKNSELINYFEIEDNGLMGKFFEDLKNDSLKYKTKNSFLSNKSYGDINKTALYVITFNSPNQFETLINSMIQYDEDFIYKPKKYLLNNSTDLTTTEKYIELCEKYGFEHIKKDNIGITGGRQFIAEHFETTGLDYYFFFEDDMFFYVGSENSCKNGFMRKVPNLYSKVMEISNKENFHFLKMNFTEFYGDNSIQWSWYNVPQVFRESHWPNNTKLPQIGLDPNAPRTKFDEIKSHKGVPYVNGEIYLCNWPVLFSKTGNYKCYLETRYASPFEQTIMSHNFQEMIKGNLKPGLLLMTPTEHNRFEHYDASLRKEC